MYVISVSFPSDIFSASINFWFISVGHHSTSDDSFAYRARSEVDDRKRIDNPLARFRLYLEGRGWWDAEAEEELKTRLKADVMKAFKHAETQSRCEVSEIFTDVYGGEEPWNIVSPFNKVKAFAHSCVRGNNERNWPGW